MEFSAHEVQESSSARSTSGNDIWSNIAGDIWSRNDGTKSSGESTRVNQSDGHEQTSIINNTDKNHDESDQVNDKNPDVKVNDKALKYAHESFNGYMEKNPPSEEIRESVEEIGNGLIDGNFKAVQQAVNDLMENPEAMQEASRYLKEALGIDIKGNEAGLSINFSEALNKGAVGSDIPYLAEHAITFNGEQMLSQTTTYGGFAGRTVQDGNLGRQAAALQQILVKKALLN